MGSHIHGMPSLGDIKNGLMTFRADIADRSTREAREARFRRHTKWMVGLLVVAFVALGAYVGGRAYLLKGMPNLPDKAAMWQLNLAPTVTLLNADGEVLGHRGPDIGRPRALTELPRHVPDAFLAIEDERFFEHEGVDRQAILRAMWTNLREGERAQGGSTLTQQLVKNLVLSPEKTYRRKIQEAILAARMEEVLTKPEILELYINRTTMGVQVFGVEAASDVYFGKPATDLSLSEAALLAAIPKAPSRLDPRKNFEAAWERAGLVLSRMRANALITLDQEQAALKDVPTLRDDAGGLLDEEVLGYAFDFAVEEAKRLVGGEAEDLVITTTLDAEKMLSARKAIETVIEQNGESKNVTEGSVVSLDNRTGAVLAMVGGRSYSDSKFNRAVQAKRQPGSSFKPFVYAAALEDGFTPGTVRIDQPITIDKWKPENYTERFRGPMTLREALKLSVNTVAAQVGAEVGPSRVAALARRFGIRDEMREVYSLSLGSSEVNLLELTGAYTVFANDGLRRPPYIVSDVADTAGRKLFQRREQRPERVYSRDYARQMSSMMQDVIENGTAYAARFGGRELAGKTGTSQDYRDAWFVGYSAQITTGVWLGNDDNSQMKEITGGLLPVDVWKAYMREAHADLPKQGLAKPDLERITPFREMVVSFYTSLSDELEAERNVAAGITTAGGN